MKQKIIDVPHKSSEMKLQRPNLLISDKNYNLKVQEK